jgi:lysozyme
MKTGPDGIALIKRFEGCKLEAYQDVIGVWTIGYGSTKGVVPGMRISQQQAEDMLASRLAYEFEPAINRAIGDAPTTQGQYDAMASLAWNIGPGAFEHHCSVPHHHVEGNYGAAAEAFKLWNKAGGQVLQPLARRRAIEAGVYRAASPGVSSPTASTPVDFVLYKTVKAVQQALQGGGLYNGQIDGKWGPQSQAAVDALLEKVGG